MQGQAVATKVKINLTLRGHSFSYVCKPVVHDFKLDVIFHSYIWSQSISDSDEKLFACVKDDTLIMRLLLIDVPVPVNDSGFNYILPTKSIIQRQKTAVKMASRPF